MAESFDSLKCWEKTCNIYSNLHSFTFLVKVGQVTYPNSNDVNNMFTGYQSGLSLRDQIGEVEIIYNPNNYKINRIVSIGNYYDICVGGFRENEIVLFEGELADGTAQDLCISEIAIDGVIKYAGGFTDSFFDYALPYCERPGDIGKIMCVSIAVCPSIPGGIITQGGIIK